MFMAYLCPHLTITFRFSHTYYDILNLYIYLLLIACLLERSTILLLKKVILLLKYGTSKSYNIKLLSKFCDDLHDIFLV